MTGFGDSNLKFTMILAISVFLSNLKFMLSRVEHENSFITSGPGLLHKKRCLQWSDLRLHVCLSNIHVHVLGYL